MSGSTKYKLTSENIAEIITLSKTKSISELAEIYGVNRRTIYYHLRKNGIKDWKKGERLYLRKTRKRDTKFKKIKLKRGLNETKSYRDYLKIENEKRNKNGLYKFKTKILH